jgi:D-3-phosphoglycerate dehydrogenase
MKVVVIAPMHERGRSLLEASYQVEYGGWAVHEPVVTPLPSDEEIVRLAQDAQAIIVPGEFSANLMRECPRLKVIGVARGDPRGVDLEEATKRGIQVVYAAGRNATAVAELTMAFAIMLPRQLVQAHQFVQDRSWGTWDDLFATTFIEGRELGNRKIGLVGFGYIGELVAQRAKAFGMRVLVYDPYVDRESIESLGLEKIDLQELMAESDIVSIHCKLTEETTGLIGAKELGWMKPDAYLINTARAAVVDEEALYEAIDSKRLAGVALDVYWQEPLPLDSRFLNLPNVIHTPHIGGATVEVEAYTAEIVAQDVDAVLSGIRPKRIANPEGFDRI